MPNVSRAEQLQAILNKAGEAACLEFFAGATEDERREVAKTAIVTFKHFRKSAQVGGRISPRHAATARLAVLSACTLTELKTLGGLATPDSGAAFEILATRRPPWLPEYAEWLLGENPRRWPLVRTLVRRELCPPPRHD